MFIAESLVLDSLRVRIRTIDEGFTHKIFHFQYFDYYTAVMINQILLI